MIHVESAAFKPEEKMTERHTPPFADTCHLDSMYCFLSLHLISNKHTFSITLPYLIVFRTRILLPFTYTATAKQHRRPATGGKHSGRMQAPPAGGREGAGLSSGDSTVKGGLKQQQLVIKSAGAATRQPSTGKADRWGSIDGRGDPAARAGGANHGDGGRVRTVTRTAV